MEPSTVSPTHSSEEAVAPPEEEPSPPVTTFERKEGTILLLLLLLVLFLVEGRDCCPLAASAAAEARPSPLPFAEAPPLAVAAAASVPPTTATAVAAAASGGPSAGAPGVGLCWIKAPRKIPTTSTEKCTTTSAPTSCQASNDKTRTADAARTGVPLYCACLRSLGSEPLLLLVDLASSIFDAAVNKFSFGVGFVSMILHKHTAIEDAAVLLTEVRATHRSPACKRGRKGWGGRESRPPCSSRARDTRVVLCCAFGAVLKIQSSFFFLFAYVPRELQTVVWSSCFLSLTQRSLGDAFLETERCFSVVQQVSNSRRSVCRYEIYFEVSCFVQILLRTK